MKVLVMSTESASFRSEANGWGADDASTVVPGKPIGLSPGYKGNYCYDCPLRAMADGWKLLAPPTTTYYPANEHRQSYSETVWYFTKD
jgi:hypothetical protein